MRRAFFVLAPALSVVVIACHERFPNALVAPQGDVADDATDAATADASMSSDASDAGAPTGCDVDAPFRPPRTVDALNGSSLDALARLTDDELIVAFVSARGKTGGSTSFFIATRASRFEPFGTPQPWNGWLEGDTDPMISGDGLRLYFASFLRGNVYNGGANYDILVASRPTRDAPFGTPVKVEGLNTDELEYSPFERAGGLWLTGIRGTPARGIFFAAGSGTMFTPATQVDVESTPMIDDMFPVPSVDGRQLYFYSTRASDGRGLGDIYLARRASTEVPFGTPLPVAEVNSESDEAPTWLSPDGCRLYLHASRNGSIQILMAEKPAK